MQTRRKVLGVDFDDVIFDFNNNFLDYNRTKYGLDLKRSDLVNFEYETIFPCSREECIRRVLEFYETPDHMKAKSIPGSLNAIKVLLKEYDIHVVTSRNEDLRPSVSAWIKNKFENLLSSLHFTSQYNAAHDHKLTKVDICDQLGIQYFVEDALHNATPIAESGRKVFLLDCPWNQAKELHPNITRVNSWEEIVKLLTN